MRIVFVILFAFASLAQIPGTFRVTGPVAPVATNSNYGATDPVYGKGGLLTGLTSLSQLQDLSRYPLARRHAGMKAVLTNGAAYKLDDTLTNWWNADTTVNSVAELLSIEPGYSGTVTALGYYSQGDGGGGTYILTNSVSYTNAYGGRLVAMGGTKSWELNVKGEVNVKQFGARGTSKADNTSIYVDSGNDQPYIQSAIDYLYTQAWPAGSVYIPAGGYVISSTNLLVQRYDDAFARMGYTSPDPAITNFWDDYPRIVIRGDGAATMLLSATTNGFISIEGKTNYSAYNNRIQNVYLHDLTLWHQLREPGTFGVNVFNAGQISIERVKTRRCYIGMRFAALSETLVFKNDIQTSAFGIWLDHDVTGNGDMGGVLFLDNNILSFTKAAFAAHYWRDIHVIGGFMGTREPGVASAWLSGLSPVACGQIHFKDISWETALSGNTPIVLIGANGTEGVYTDPIYPFNTYTNTQVSFRGVHFENDNFSYGCTNGLVRIRGANTAIPGRVTFHNNWFDSTLTRWPVIIEQDVPDSVVVEYQGGNLPVNMMLKTYDSRTNFLTTLSDQNLGNVLNIGWRTMDKGGNVWTGSQAPTTVRESLAGPFGVELTGGAERSTQVLPFAGGTPITLKSNTPIVIDYAVKWDQTNLSPHLAIRLLDRSTGTYYDPATLGGVGWLATYTNSWGVWKRYVGDFILPDGVECDRIVFNNFGATNDTVVLGYLSIYAKNIAGDGSSFSPGAALLWAGRYEDDHIQWTLDTASINPFARKLTAGWAVRGAFSGAINYDRGTCVTSSGNVYLAVAAISSGGAAPTHGSGTVGDWYFVATGSATVESRVQMRSTIEGGVTSLFTTTSLGSITSPYDRQLIRTYGYSGFDEGGALFGWIAGYAGTTNAFGTPRYQGAAYAFTGGAWVQLDQNMVNSKQFNISGSQTNTIGFPTRILGQTLVAASGSPDASAALHVSSTTQGVLITPMTKAQRDAISSPANGLQVYQTDAGNYGPRWYSTTAAAWIKADGTTDP